MDEYYLLKDQEKAEQTQRAERAFAELNRTLDDKDDALATSRERYDHDTF